MKKIIALLLIFAALFTLCACSSDNDNVADATEETTKLEVSNNPVTFFDENGAVILKSSENRSVFREDDGSYVIFWFNGDIVYSVLHVLVYNTAEEAKTEFETVKASAESSEGYGSATLSENHIALTVTPFHTTYGKYMQGGTRATVDIDYPDAMKLS